ncbi:MAG: hypothetical protein QOH32_585 [Bradyrhizobium sp.]|jgi:hypothetical protein|nr:hypothetical protein [Bradyrhizobium sp.]
MDESKPSIPPDEFRFRFAPERTAAGTDPPPADGRSVAVYHRNEEEVSRGFLIAPGAMGVAHAEQLPAPAKPPVRGAKP